MSLASPQTKIIFDQPLKVDINDACENGICVQCAEIRIFWAQLNKVAL